MPFIFRTERTIVSLTPTHTKTLLVGGELHIMEGPKPASPLFIDVDIEYKEYCQRQYKPGQAKTLVYVVDNALCGVVKWGR